MSFPSPQTPPRGEQPGARPAYWQAGVPTQEERNWALAAHLGTFVSAWVALGFLCPLIILLLKGSESAFVRRQAVESLNFQITLLIYLAISFVLAFVLIGLLLMALVGLLALVTVIIATVKAANGEDYRYPLTLRLVK